MKVAVISDIHGNLPALEAVLDDMPDVDRVVCCGDIIGILGWPVGTIDLVQESCDDIIAGNHDCRLREDFVYTPTYTSARDEMKVTSSLLTEESIEWLNQLPLRIETDDYMMAHSWPKEFQEGRSSIHGLSEDDYGVQPKDFTKAGRAADGKTVMLGHTHEQHKLKLDKFEGLSGFIMNPGSVGVPWYGDADYAIVDTESQEADLMSVEYNNEVVSDRLDKHDEQFGLTEW